MKTVSSNPIAKVFDISFEIECCYPIEIILPYMGENIPISYSCLCGTTFTFYLKKKYMTFTVKMTKNSSNKRTTLF
jgi:hypothetical protein